MNKQTYAVFVFAFVALLGALVVPMNAFAARKEDKIKICHATDSHTNPYTNPDVDPDAVDGDAGNDNGQGDHYLEHNGPVWFDGIPDHSWGDIIPPIEGVHQGKNWTEEGQRVHGNGCSFIFAEPTPEATPSATPTATPSATPTQDPTPTPGDPGNGGGGTGGGSSTPSTPAPQGEVLGATTYAATGVAEDIAANVAGLMGFVSFALALKTKKRSEK